MRATTAARYSLGLLLLLIGFTGCRYITGSQDPQVIVDVLGEDDEPFRPDRVYWYYPPVDGAVEDHEASCLNFQCTRWGVEGASPGTIYVAATYMRPPGGAVCIHHAYDATPVEVDPAERPHVILRMEVLYGCE